MSLEWGEDNASVFHEYPKFRAVNRAVLQKERIRKTSDGIGLGSASYKCGWLCLGCILLNNVTLFIINLMMAIYEDRR